MVAVPSLPSFLLDPSNSSGRYRPSPDAHAASRLHFMMVWPPEINSSFQGPRAYLSDLFSKFDNTWALTRIPRSNTGKTSPDRKFDLRRP